MSGTIGLLLALTALALAMIPLAEMLTTPRTHQELWRHQATPWLLAWLRAHNLDPSDVRSCYIDERDQLQVEVYLRDGQGRKYMDHNTFGTRQAATTEVTRQLRRGRWALCRLRYLLSRRHP